MKTKLTKGCLVFAMVLFGVLSTHVISADAEDDTTVAQETAGATVVSVEETATQATDSITESSERAETGSTTESSARGTEVADTRTQATASIPGSPGVAETGSTTESSARGTEVADTGTQATASIPGSPGVAETGSTAKSSTIATEVSDTGTQATASTPGSPGDVDTGSTAESTTIGAGVTTEKETQATVSFLGSSGGEETGSTAGQAGSPGAVALEASTTAGELSTSRAGGAETGTSPTESSTGEKGVTETASTAEIGTSQREGGTSSALLQKYTTGKPETEDTTAPLQKTNETATATNATSVGQTGTEGQTKTTARERATDLITTPATPAGSQKSCKKWTKITIKTPAETFRCNLTICEVGHDDKQKYKYNVTLFINETRNETWLSEMDKNIFQINSTDLSKWIKDSLTANLSGKRIRRQTSEEETETIEEEISVEVERNLTIDDVVNAFKKILPETTETSAVAPSDPVKEPTAPGKQGIWEAHFGLFLTVIILIAVCIVVTGVCCLCMIWRGRGRDRHPDKQPVAIEEARADPTAVSNPIPDAEMIQDEAPMQERENPAVTPNGGGQHISKAEEDNGWVVPLDELSKAEKEKPEVENTRL